MMVDPFQPPEFTSAASAEAWVAARTTEELRHLWDDPALSSGICDEIYTEMQRRGEGFYVAI